MSVRFAIPTALRGYTDGKAAVEVEGATVAAALADLVRVHPQLRAHLYDGGGKLRSFVNLYVGDEDIRYLEGEATALKDGASVSIIPSIAGGAR